MIHLANFLPESLKNKDLGPVDFFRPEKSGVFFSVNRAKSRLYVIGDAREWGRQKHFSVLTEHLHRREVKERRQD